MKKRISLFSLLAINLILSACSETEIPVPLSNEEKVLASIWKVSWFWDKVKDETSDFNGYAFNFGDNGILTASAPGGQTFTGTWTFGSDSEGNEAKMIISITGNHQLDEISDDWRIIRLDEDKIELREDDGQGEEEELHLTNL